MVYDNYIYNSVILSVKFDIIAGIIVSKVTHSHINNSEEVKNTWHHEMGWKKNDFRYGAGRCCVMLAKKKVATDTVAWIFNSK